MGDAPMSDFPAEVVARQQANRENAPLQARAKDFFVTSHAAQYSYNFTWLGRPIIQYPQDLGTLQQIVWTVQPEVIIETGVAHGGSLIFYASLLALNELCGGPSGALVFGIDVEIRAHNRQAIRAHPLSNRIVLLEADSLSPMAGQMARALAEGKRTLVCLDSLHTHRHVLGELETYAPLVSPGSYCVVFDTIVDALPRPQHRPWGPGNSPHSAVQAYLTTHPEFEVDRAIEDALVLTANPGGYLLRIA
jgi:cephalosporin hydroxylase